ncbi:MAG: signal peptidase [Chloroflexota bacterium]|jgi:signal peptidase|nr:signal peptidase [Chloroflexota bacterium]
MRTGSRRILKFATMAAVLAIWVVLLRPQSLGGPALYIVIRGTSMLPTYQNGDLVVIEAAPRYAAGDAVAYRVPSGEIGEGHVIVHRITGGDGTDGFTVQGDNNNAVDPWMPRATDVAGKSWVVVPGVGRLIAIVHQPVIAGGLAAGVMVSLILAGQSRPKRAKPAARAP